MRNEDNYDDKVEEIFNGLGNLVGEGEIEARRILGDAQYDKAAAMLEQASLLSLAQDAGRVRYLESTAFLQSAIGLSLLSAVVIGVAWSFYFWFK